MLKSQSLHRTDSFKRLRLMLFLVGGSLLISGCVTSPEPVCRLDSAGRAQAWAESVLVDRNDPQGVPRLAFAPGTLRLSSTEEYPEGYIVRFSAAHKETSQTISLYVRMHSESCTFSTGGA